MLLLLYYTTSPGGGEGARECERRQAKQQAGRQDTYIYAPLPPGERESL